MLLPYILDIQLIEQKKRKRVMKKPNLCEHIRIPKIINGDIYTLEDGYNIKKETGANSLMIARGAQNNCSIFDHKVYYQFIMYQNAIYKLQHNLIIIK